MEGARERYKLLEPAANDERVGQVEDCCSPEGELEPALRVNLRLQEIG